MKPAYPVVDGVAHLQLGAGQPQYDVLPAVRADGPAGELVTRWELSDEDRARIAAGGSVYLHILTFGHPVQPVVLGTEPPEFQILTPDGITVRRAR